MFEIGDYVMYAGKGICRVEEEVMLDISMMGNKKLYYLMVPIEDSTVKLYLSVDGENHKVRKVLNKDQFMELLSGVSDIEEVQVVYDKQREQIYKEALNSGNPKKLIGIIKAIYSRKVSRDAEGKKNTSVDERFFKLAENTLYSEMAFALQISKEESKELVIRHLDETFVC